MTLDLPFSFFARTVKKGTATKTVFSEIPFRSVSSLRMLSSPAP